LAPRRSASGQVAYADTNIFVALFAGPAHPLHEPALEVFRRVANGRLSLVVTALVVSELVYVTRSLLGWNRQRASEHLASLLDADGLVVPEREVLQSALQLYRDRSRLDFADAYLAACGLTLGPPLVASFDRDLDAVQGLRRISG
jgi:predicted nucleic acid-binding protein